MPGALKIDVAELAGIIAEGPVFGIFLVLDTAALYILLARRRHGGLNIPLISAAIVMMLLAVSQFIVDSLNIFMAFIPHDRQARIAFLSDTTQHIFAAKHAIYFTMMLVGDAIVIYRCYVVWNSKIWIVAFPILCSLGSAVCAYRTIWDVGHPSFQASYFRLERDMGFIIFSLSFGANAFATSLLAYKVWKSEQNLQKILSASPYRKSLLPIARITAESGLVNTAYLLAYTIILQNGTNAIQIMACIVTPLVGIIFATVIIRAALAAQAAAMASTSERGFTMTPSSTVRDHGANKHGIVIHKLVEVKGSNGSETGSF